eukprot:TRINITY_DN782_c0_g1_i1.p1 TRINITY_DN782_c0_g1~~TRINITY_DN782_c0_g1_i1.p1  ORF type:complete len:456 (+),score=108.86 TRINITY_DN782_c0_g1_i1:191-1558(+)
MDNTFIPKAMDLVKEAVEADNKDDLEKALSLYKQGLQYFMTGLKYTKNERSKTAIREKMVQYMGRAEIIKEQLDKKTAPKKQVVKSGVKGDDNKDSKESKEKKESSSSSSGSNNKDADSKDEEEEDEDTKKLKASLQGAIVMEKPNVKWEDVAGLEQAKNLLKEAVVLPVRFPQLFTGKRKPWKGILMYGPPGTGKTFVAKAVATEAGSSCFFAVSSSDLVSKYQGESEKLVRCLFELARKKAPSIVFIDEVDSLASSRGDGENESARRIKTEFLVQMEGVGKGKSGVLVLAATNIPWDLDAAIRRRFEKRVYIPLPDKTARLALFKIHIGNTPNNLTTKDLDKLAEKTEGYSGADISVLVRDALYEPVRVCQQSTHFKKVKDPSGKQDCFWEPCSPEDPKAEEKTLMDIPGEQLRPLDVTGRNFESALKTSKATVAQKDLAQFEKWTKDFGMEG